MRQPGNDFDEIYKKYAKKVYYYILKMCGNKEMAEDILQHTFLKAIEHADSFENNCSITTWLCQIARNTYLDEMKKREHNNISLNEEIEAYSDDILKVLIDQNEKVQLYKHIHKLKEPQKEIILHRLICMSYKEIGEVFNQRETWARVNFYRAKEKLQKMIVGD